jgi:hypothetical protein
MDQLLNNVGIIITGLGAIIFVGSFFGTTKKRLNQLEDDIKQSNKFNVEVIDKLARIETKLDYLTNSKN